jgi:3-phenylpropionate/cinnamic acid dioxygenase small subunit
MLLFDKAARVCAAAVLAGGLASGCVAVTEEHHGDPALEARLAELEAKEEIRSLIVNYGRFLDGRDYAAYASLFAENGVWTGGFGTFEGRDAIERMLSDNLGPRPVAGPREPLPTLHLVSNELIDVDGDRATAISKWFFINAGADGAPRMLLAGRYEDEFVREGGRWLIARRTAIGDIPPDEATADR